MKKQAVQATKLEIYYSRPKCLGWFLVYLSCCFGLGFLPFISGYVLTGAVLGLFFGAAALQHLICIFYTKPGIILSKHGFILNRPFRSAELRWNEICGFTQMSYKGVLTFQIRSGIVALYLSKPNNFPEKQPLPKKLCFLAEDKLFGSCIRFYFNIYKYDYFRFLTDLETAYLRFR